MKFNLLKIVLISFPLFSYSQKYANIWYFSPAGGGLDFNTCSPVVLTDGWKQPDQLFEGSVTMCNENGELLFYTGGKRVINVNHVTMQNGDDLGPVNNTLTQNLIVKKPGSDNIYYIITPEIQAGGSIGNPAASIIYAEVDMALDGGLGGVVSFGNIFKDTLSGRSCEKLTAVRHSNGEDIWVIAHEYGNNKFLAYSITQTGINTTPVISLTGPVIVSNQSSANAIGELKAAPNGKKIAFTAGSTGTTAIFDFDNGSGIVSNPVELNILGNGITVFGYGVSFSPDNKKLYISAHVRLDLGSSFAYDLMQFDISSGNISTIQNSKAILFSSPLGLDKLYSLKLAPDKKIYCAKEDGNGYLGVIHSPDLAGAAANYIHNGLYLDGLSSTWGLNNAMELLYYCGEEPPIEEPPITELKIPNIFTPNSDGTNDTFIIENLPTDARVQIYNRWGVLVAEWNKPDGSWDGRTKGGSQVSAGVYYYIVTLPDGERMKGFVEVIR